MDGFRSLAIGIVFAGALMQGMGAEAAPLKVVNGATDSGIQARIKTDSLGGIKVPSGSVKFSGTDVSIGAVPDWLFDRHVVLTGKLIDHRITTVDGKTAVQGTFYLLGGDWVNALPDLKRRDNLELTDGTILAGRIRAINADNIDFQVQTGQTRRIKSSEVKSVSSPRAFTFNIPAVGAKVDATSGNIEGEADSGTFTATSIGGAKKLIASKSDKVIEPKSTLAGAEGGVTKKALTTMIVLDAVNTLAPAIVAPIVAPLGSRDAVGKLREVGIQEGREQAAGMFVQPR